MAPANILDKSLGGRKTEVNLSTFALLFSEMVCYAQSRVNSIPELQDKLKAYGRSVGVRMLEVIVFRENKSKRETRLLQMLLLVKSTVWRNLFGREADKLERSNDDKGTYLLIEKEPLVNTFISVPKDKGGLNCAAFVAGIIEAMLEASNFPCEVTAHWHNGTAYVIKFDPVVTQREDALAEGSR